MTMDIQYPFISEFGGQGKEIFKSQDELQNFFREELEKWLWMENIHLPIYINSSFQEREAGSIFGPISRWFELARNIINENFDLAYVEEAASLYQGDFFFKFNSPYGMFINSHVTDDDPKSPYIAFGIFLAFTKMPVRNKVTILYDQNTIEGSFLARGYLSNRKASNLTLVKTAYKEACDRIAHNENNLSEFIKEKTNLYGKYAADQERVTSERNLAFDEKLSSTHNKFNELEQIYNERLKLQAPAKYWIDERDKHLLSHRIWLSVTSVYFIIVLAFLYCAISRLLPNFIAELIAKNEKFSDFQYLYIFAALTVMTVIFWIGRILTRMMLSERHLATDAAERSVMAQTYLALLHEKGAEKEERPLVLASLFRNSSDGIVKEDGAADTSLSAIVAKLMMPK